MDEPKLTADSARQYEKATYYGGRWKPEYERWVDMLAGLNQSPGQESCVKFGADLEWPEGSDGAENVEIVDYH